MGDVYEPPETAEFHITTSSCLYTKFEISDLLEHIRETVVSRLENTQAQLQGSGWVIKEISKFEISFCKFVRGVLGAYTPYPVGVRGKDNIFNPRTSENCVLIALASHFYIKQKPSVRPFRLANIINRNARIFWQDRVNIGNLDSSSIGWESLAQLEKLNNIGINVYSLSKQTHNKSKYNIQLVYNSRTKYERVNLLLLNDNHIALIKDLKVFYRRFCQKLEPIRFICERCLTSFKEENDSIQHSIYCTAETTVEYPQPGEKLGFQKFKSLYPHPYVAFADFESLNKKVPNEEQNSHQLATQHAFAFKYSIIDIRCKTQYKISKEKSYFGEDCINHFLSCISEDWKEISSKINFPVNFSPADMQIHAEKKKCDICKSSFNKTNLKKTKHHFHYLEENNYAGTLCTPCNLKLRSPFFLPVIFHNLSYDLSLILKQYDENTYDFKVNKKGGMNFYSASVGKLKLVDSMNMIKGSLANLADHHILNNGDLTIVKESLKNFSHEAQELLCATGKQFFPYEYLDSFDKLEETSLPPINQFYSSLTDSNIKPSDYQHAQSVWARTGCRTLKDYVSVYLSLDVSLLADIYLQWRNVLLDLFGLDCLYFLTLASYAIESMFHKCAIKLDTISDPALYSLINTNIRGGFCSVGKRHIIANNKDTNPNFDPVSMKSNYLLYVDFNSLYPSVMSKFKLPIGDFIQLQGEEFDNFKNQDLTALDIEGETGYYIYCDIDHIKPEIAEKTDSYPLLISPMNIEPQHLSEFSTNLLKDKNIKLPKNNTKLVAHHLGVKNYLITLPLLQFLIKNGVEVSKIHKVFKFRQEFYLKHFIDENIKMRAAATNPFIKAALKLINNSIYGRTLLNPLNYATEAKLCHDNNNSDLLKSFSRPTFRKVDIINDDRFLVTYNKANVKAASPIYVGFSILDHAKLFMYKFWYSTIVPTYGERAQFVYTDTDSFIINIETEDIMKEINGPLSNHLDLSNFPCDHPLYSDRCKGELGRLKIETGVHFIKEFVGLKPKAYTYTTTQDDKACNNTLKGVPKHIRNSLNLQCYKQCLYSNSTFRRDIFNLRFYNKHMSLVKNNKIILSSFEDKRFYINSFKSYAYGHPLAVRNRESNNEVTKGEDRGKRKNQNKQAENTVLKKQRIGM